ncbi:MAG TPA: shikimate kinase [Rhizomicrobium sp.]|jgi:shikimate kinase|nr:shikimate kinase [Rhizomicrobium sp.]
MNVVLVGYRGSGKTTIGRLLAERLWVNFVDLDEMIVARAGKSIKAIFDELGENGFRDLETNAIAEAVKETDTVLALGGGALGREENRALLRSEHFRIIYLRCDAEELLRRITADPQTALARPSLTRLGGSLEEVATLLAQREPIYREMMHGELDVTHLTPREAVVHIARMV